MKQGEDTKCFSTMIFSVYGRYIKYDSSLYDIMYDLSELPEHILERLKKENIEWDVTDMVHSGDTYNKKRTFQLLEYVLRSQRLKEQGLI